MTNTAFRNIFHFFIVTTLLIPIAELAGFAPGNYLEENDVQYVILPEPKCLKGIRIEEHQALQIRSAAYQSTNRYDQWLNIEFTIGKEGINFRRYTNTASLQIIRNPENDPKRKPELLDRLIYCPADHQYQNESKKRKIFNQSVLERMIGGSRYKRQSQGLASKLTKTTTLAFTDSPYEVNSLVIVPEDVDLIIEQGVTLYFEPGTGFLVRGQLIVDGTFNRVIKMLPKDANSTWNGIVVETTKSSSGQNSRTMLKSLVINNAYIGLLIRGYDSPFIEDLTVAASTRDGLVVDSDFIVNVTVRKCRLINNKGYGIRIRTGGSTVAVSMNEILIAGSELTGLLLESSATSRNFVKMIDIRNAAFFNNGRNGLDVQANFETFKIDRTISASNGKYAMFFKTADDNLVGSVQISRLNVTGHWYNAALVVESSLSSFSISRSNFWENYNGCMKFVGCVKLISIFENQYSRNRNSIISINSTCPNSSISIIKNNYTLNLLNNRILNQSIVAIHSNSSSIQSFHNNFVKNTAFNVILIENSPKDFSTDIFLINNSFKDNLAPNIITLSSSKMNLTKNMLDNPISVCEIRILNSTTVSVQNFADNIWADVNAVLPGKKICLSTIKDVQSDEDNIGITGILDVATFTSMDSKAEGMVAKSLRQNMVDLMTNRSVVFRARNESYKIETSLFIRSGSTMIVEPGTTLEMWPNQGIYIFGQLIANGTPNEPIIFRSRSLETWSGIYLDNEATENSSILAYCILDRSDQGLILRSNNVILSNCVISRPKFAGVTLVIDDNGNNVESKSNKFFTKNHFISFDFDSTKIMESQGSGLKIINTKYPIEIRSLIAEQVAGNCIDLENDPKFDIRILNSSFSDCQRYAVSIERLIGGSNQTLILSENLIANQRGLGGVYVSGIDYGTVVVKNNTFRNSLVPNLIIILKCNPWIDSVPKFDLISNKFDLNEDLSADVRLIDCVEANITMNWFNNNNNYRHKGTFRLEMEPSPVFVNQSLDKFNIDFRHNTFTANKGDFSIYFLTDNMNRFRSNVQFNYFRTNENRRSSLILGSPLFFVHENQFLDEKYGHKLEVEFSDDGRYLDASKNYWSTDNETEILESILDGRKIQGRGKVTFEPFLKNRNETEFVINFPIDYNIGKNSSSVETSTLLNSPDCSSLKFCHYNGLCISNSVCLCNAGYSGQDCRLFTCSTLNNCNGNGRCTGPNFCSCFDGWSGRRCETANCSSLHECHGHGTCVSYNECECFNGYVGVDCSQTVNDSTSTSSSIRPLIDQSTHSQQLRSPSTTLNVLENIDQNISFRVTTTPAYCSFCNYRGTCSNEQLCSCSVGWYGRRCELGNCSQVNNCSGRGLCAGANVCQCFVGYAGKDCGTCSNEHCLKVACDKPCLHGMCNYANGTCRCKNGWTGDGCGFCENGADPHTNCHKNKTQITYILAKNTDSENTVFYVHGTDLPKNSVCKLDSGIMSSLWFSSDYMVCNTTNSSSPEIIKTLYIESPSGTRIPAPTDTNDMIFSNVKPICGPGTCSADHGSCVENMCFCDAGWKDQCRETIVPSEIGVLSASNISSWQEGQPLDIDFHIQKKSLKAHWQTVKVPKGATIDPETGIFHWPKPIGSNNPINITVSATTALGTLTRSYSINIRPSYNPILDQVLITSDNLLFFNGTTNFGTNSSFSSNVVVDILFYFESEDGRAVATKIPTTADDQGQFYGEFSLDDDLLGKNLKIVACHPADCDSIVENGLDTLGLKYITYDVQGLRIDPKFVSLSYDSETGQIDFQFMVENFYPYNINNVQLLAKQLPTYVSWKPNSTNFDLKPMEKQFIGVHINNLSSFDGFLRFKIDSQETSSKYATVELYPTMSNRTRLNINDQTKLNHQFNSNNHGAITRIHAPCSSLPIAGCGISIDIPSTSGLFQISRIANQKIEAGDSWFLIGHKNVSSEFGESANESQIQLLSKGILTQSIKFSITPGSTTQKINFKIFGEMIDSVDNQLHKIVLSQVDIQLSIFNETLHFTTDEYGRAIALISNCCYDVQLRKDGYETYSTNLVVSTMFDFEFFMKLLRPTSKFIIKKVSDASSYDLEFENMNLSSLTIPYIAPVQVNCGSFGAICTSTANLRSSGLIDALNIDWTSENTNASVWTMDTDRGYKKALNLSVDFVNADPSIKENCFAVILQPTFEYMVDDRRVLQNFDLLIRNTDADQPSVNLCTISTDGTMTMSPYKLRVPVFCDCDKMHRKHCTKNYNSLTLCGQIWNGHTYPSISTIIQLLAFISNCQYSGVSIDNAMNSIKCLLQQSKFCGEASENRLQSLGWLQSSNSKLNGAISMDMEHLILRLHNDYQLYDILQQYKDLLEIMADILKFPSFDNMRVNSWLSEFKRSISDYSELNELISNGEEHIILNSANHDSSHEKDKFRLKSFISVFNSTMRRWFNGEQFLDRKIIQYSTLQNLTTNLKFLSDIAEQQSLNNIFDLLDEYIYDTSYATEKESQLCLEVTLQLSKVDFVENDLLHAEIEVRNVRQDTEIKYLSLLIKVVDAETLNVVDQFIEDRQPPKEIYSLSYDQTWETTCTIGLTPKTRLYRNFGCKIQVEISFNAATENMNSTSIIYSQRFTVSPKPSLKIFHFFNDSTIYPSIISFFMNNGYVKLENLSLVTTKLIMKEIDGDQHQTSYSLERVIMDDETRILDFDQTMRNLASGQVSYIKYDLKTDSSSYVHDFDQTVLNNGAFMEVEVKKFRVLRTLGVSSKGLPKFLIKNFGDASNETLWVFNPDTTILQHVVPSVPGNRPIESTRTAGNASYRILLITFPAANLHSGDAMLGSFDASFLNETYTCLMFRSRDHEFSVGDFWIDSNSRINFVDAFLSSNISSIQYEFTFGTKIDTSLEFVDPPNNITLDFDNEIGEELIKIRTFSGQQSNVRYSIFDKQNLFKIDDNSGSITLNRNFLFDANDYCLTVFAQTDGSSPKAVNSTMVKVIFPRKYHEDFECTPFTYNAAMPDESSTTTTLIIQTMSTVIGSISTSRESRTLSRETTSIPITSTNNAPESLTKISKLNSSSMTMIPLVVTEVQTTSTSTETFSQTSTPHQATSSFISMPIEQTVLATDFSLQSTRSDPILIVSTVAFPQTSSQLPSYEFSTSTSVSTLITSQMSSVVDHVLTVQTAVLTKSTDGQLKNSTTAISTTVKSLPSMVTNDISTGNYQSTTFMSNNATFETNIDQTLIAHSISPTDIRAYNNEDMVRTACGLRHTKLVYAVICDLGKRKINPG